jgi:hypothetical protein
MGFLAFDRTKAAQEQVTERKMSKQKMKHCAHCGEELGMTEDWDREPEACINPECKREVHAMYREEREQAHERLDRDMGW